MNYEQKKEIADAYLYEICYTCWDELPDVNSLHDAETEEEIKALCDDRLRDENEHFLDLID